MKRLLLFLVLAAGGIAALGALGGGFTGSTVQQPPPVVSLMPEKPREAGAPDLPKTSELPGLDGGMGGRAAQAAPVAVDEVAAYNQTVAERVTYVDPVSGDKIEIPNAPKAYVAFKNAGPMRDASGAPGMRWQKVHIVLYKDKKDYTHAVAEALRANPLTGRKGLELFDITADEGFETTTTLPPAPGEKEARGRTVIRITKNVLIHDCVRNLDVRTSDAEIDYDAQTAVGRAPAEVESKAYVVRGRGFRIDCVAQRLEILENTEFEALDLAGEPSKSPAAAESGAVRPRRLQAKGSTLIVRHTEEKEPFTDVRMEGGVHVEMDGGQQLDAASVALKLVRRAPTGTTKADGSASPEQMNLERMSAEGDVRYEGKDKGGSLLTAQGPKLAVDFRDRQVNSVRLGGRSLVTWRGEMALPGDRPADRIVAARATESILFAPDAETPGASLLDLVGTARVECGRVPTDPIPQRLAADRVTLHLRRRALPPEGGAATTSPERGRRQPMAEWVATAFAATGGVIIEGPRLSGAAREMKGFDLDRPAFHVTATGPDAHLEVADDAEPRKPARAAEPGAAAQTSAPRRTWMLDHLAARENAMGELRVRAGEGGARFAGDSMSFGRTTGAEIRAAAGKDAHLTLEGREGRDRTIDANTIWLRPGAEERTLETAGRTRTVFWVGDEEPVTSPASGGPGHRVIELRSASRIDISGSRGSKDADATLAVTLADGGALSARTDGVVTDRLTATTIEVALVETLPVAGELGFALAGHRTDGPSPAKGAGPAKPQTSNTTPPGRFVLDSDSLQLAIGTESRAGSAGALRRVRADGNVKASGDDAKEGPRQFEGARFDYDARSGVGVLLGTARRSAVVTLGREPAIDRLVSPRIQVDFKDGKLVRAAFAAPVRGVFHTKPATTGGAAANPNLDRFVLESFGGGLTVEGDTAVVEGSTEKPVVVQRTTLNAAGAVIGAPMTIRTVHLTLTTSEPFGKAGATLKSLDASGPGTTIETGGTDPAKREYAVGDSIRFERPVGAAKGAPGAEGVLRITSAQGTVRVVKAGSSLEGYDVVYDFATRTISAKIKRADLGGSK